MGRSATKRTAVLLACCAVLGGCYTSEADLLGEHKNTIELADPMFGYNGMVSYFEGSGETVQLCTAGSRSKFRAGCSSMGKVSVERTLNGNYIVQKTRSQGGYHYGVWYRSYSGNAGGAGRQCFEWLGEGLLGESLKFRGPLRRGGPEFAKRILGITASENITREQLLTLAFAYEMRFEAEEACLGEWLFIEPATVIIEGDRRHRRAFD